MIRVNFPYNLRYYQIIFDLQTVHTHVSILYFFLFFLFFVYMRSIRQFSGWVVVSAACRFLVVTSSSSSSWSILFRVVWVCVCNNVCLKYIWNEITFRILIILHIFPTYFTVSSCISTVVVVICREYFVVKCATIMSFLS